MPLTKKTKLKLIPSKPGWGLFQFAPFPFNALREGLQQVRFSHFAFLSLPFFLGVWCHLLLHFFLSWIKNRKSLSEVPIWYFQNGSPFFLSHCFLIPPRKQSDTKKKERQQRHTQKQRKMIQEKMQSDTRKKAK